MTTFTFIHLHNIQSHTDTTIKLTTGLNVVVGLSDAGKSVIMRALLWIITGRPLGDGLCRRGEKEFSVTVGVGRETTVTRRKTPSENQYIIEVKGSKPEVFNAIGHSVPPEVEKLFNIDIRTQIHRQKARPFLLDESSGDVSRFINEIARLDDIDVSLKWLNSDIRTNRQEEARAKATADALTTEYQSLGWVDQLLGCAEGLEIQNRELDRTIVQARTLRTALSTASGLSKDLFRLKTIQQLHPKAKQLQTEEQRIARICDEADTLGRYIDTARRSSHIQQMAAQTSLLRPMAEVLLKTAAQLAGKNTTADHLASKIEQGTKLYEGVSQCHQDANQLRAALPAVCPECGQPVH